MIEALSTKRNVMLTVTLLVISGLSMIGADGVGISDNPPGILLAYLSAAALVLAFVHPWRSSKPYRRLIIVSAAGLLIFAVLHNVFDALAGGAENPGLLHSLLEGASVASFLIALLVCPPAFLIGIAGAAIMSGRKDGGGSDAPPVG